MISVAGGQTDGFARLVAGLSFLVAVGAAGLNWATFRRQGARPTVRMWRGSVVGHPAGRYQAIMIEAANRGHAAVQVSNIHFTVRGQDDGFVVTSLDGPPFPHVLQGLSAATWTVRRTYLASGAQVKAGVPQQVRAGAALGHGPIARSKWLTLGDEDLAS